MHNNSLESVIVVIRVLQPLLFFKCIVKQIELMWKLPSGVDLLVLKFVVIEADTL